MKQRNCIENSLNMLCTFCPRTYYILMGWCAVKWLGRCSSWLFIGFNMTVNPSERLQHFCKRQKFNNTWKYQYVKISFSNSTGALKMAFTVSMKKKYMHKTQTH